MHAGQDPGELLSQLRERVDERIANCVPHRSPAELYDPARYVMDAPGKRFRPILTLLASGLHGGSAEIALPAAASVEIFHNFTLVHDDIMDRADTRRGRPTVHVRWDEPTGVLVGDLLFGLAYEQLSETSPDRLPALLRVFSDSVHALCAGQMLDMVFERRAAVTVTEYVDMIDQKTGALLSCALRLGALVAGGSAVDADRMHELGINLGRAFQIQDDLLDLTADDERWGKRIGGDILEGKRTYLLLSAVAKASSQDADFFSRIMAGKAEDADIVSARDRMHRLGVLDDARNAVDQFSDAAVACLEAYEESIERAALFAVVNRLRERAH